LPDLTKKGHKGLEKCGNRNLTSFGKPITVPKGLDHPNVFGHKPENGQIEDKGQS
jgi:hypothetical protein